jgi:hypothetical protein
MTLGRSGGPLRRASGRWHGGRRLVYLIDKQGTIRYGKPGMHWNEAFFTALGSLG